MSSVSVSPAASIDLATAPEAVPVDEAKLMRVFTAVYGWMAIGLGITAITTWTVIRSTYLFKILAGSPLVLLFVGAELALAFAIPRLATRLKGAWVACLFVLFAGLNGVTLSAVFCRYNPAIVASAFLITSLMFVVMSICGRVTRRDLTALNNLLVFGLIGVIGMSIVNFFAGSSLMTWAITQATIVIFLGLIACDTKMIKDAVSEMEDDDTIGAIAVFGALMLYLDFINLLLAILKTLARRD